MAGPGRGRRQRPGRPGGGPAGRAGLVRPQQPAPPARSRIVVRARLRGHRRPARPDPADRPVGPCRGVRYLPALHDGLSDRGAGGRRRPRRPPLPGLAGPGPRHLPGRVPGRPRRPHLRVRRLPAGLPDQPHRRPSPPAGTARGRLGGRCRPPRPPGRHRRRPARGPRSVVHRRARSPAPAAQRPGGPGQRRRRGRSGHRRRAGRLHRRRRRAAGRARPLGGRPTRSGRPGPRARPCRADGGPAVERVP